jgi:hypothetical protein
MLSEKVELNRQGKLPTRDALEACAPQLATWQKLFSHRYTRHSESPDALDTVENVHGTACGEFAGSDPGNGIVPRFFPSVRISP